MEAGTPITTVATVLEPAVRARVEAAAGHCFDAVHAQTLGEAIRAVRDRPVNAVLVSPTRVGGTQLHVLARLVRDFPGVATVALVSGSDAQSSERLLQLGTAGVRHLVDLSRRDGFDRLRALVAEEACPIGARIAAAILPAFANATTSAQRFAELIVWGAPTIPTVRELCERVHVPTSTFMSRFFRAGLPSPKRYLAATRLLHAAALFEIPGLSISDIAYRLNFSSPQSFGRHIRAAHGVTASEFRRRYTLETAATDYHDRLVWPFRTTFRTFYPL